MRTDGKASEAQGSYPLGEFGANIDFSPLCQLLSALGFEERVRGSHHIFTRADEEEIVNLQPKGSKAKPCQVCQVRNLLLKYRLGDAVGFKTVVA